MNINEMVAALEAVLFAGGEPVSSARLCEVFEIDDETLSKLLKMLSNKLEDNNSGIKFPKVSVLCHPGIELQNFFSSPFDDLEKIETIVDNQYFYEFLEKMYSDYKGFLEIFPYIDLEVIDY